MNKCAVSRAKPIIQTVDLLRGKWTVPILCVMCMGPARLSDLKRRIPGASKKALIAHLHTLESSGIVERKDMSSSVLHVEYHIVSQMKGPVASLLLQLADWSQSHLQRGVGQPMASLGMSLKDVRCDCGCLTGNET